LHLKKMVYNLLVVSNERIIFVEKYVGHKTCRSGTKLIEYMWTMANYVISIDQANLSPCKLDIITTSTLWALSNSLISYLYVWTVTKKTKTKNGRIGVTATWGFLTPLCLKVWFINIVNG
jgi:hypothetical protein